MLYEISYYLFSSVCLGSLCLGVSWIVYPENTQQFLYTTSWEVTKNALILKDKAKRMYDETTKNIKPKKKPEKKEYLWEMMIIDEKNNNINLKSYTLKQLTNKYNKSLKSVSEKITYIKKIINDKEYWKEIDINYFWNITKSEQIKYLKDIDIIEKPFIQVLLHNDGKDIDINEYLESFYVNNNQILDIVFLKWYVYYYYNIKLDENYTLDIIDSNVKMNTLKKYDSILITNNVYEINSDAC